VTFTDKKQLGLARKFLRDENRNYPEHLVSIPRDMWPDSPETCVRVWRSRHFVVQVHLNKGWTRLSVCRADLDSHGRWKDGITWDELQRLKREAGYGDQEAVEVYPADADVVDVANIRHLWIVPAGMPFTWRKESKRSEKCVAS
jgi:hypothetical protein